MWSTEEIFGVILFLGVVGVFVGLFVLGIFVQSLGGSDGKYVGYVSAIEQNQNIGWDSELVYLKSELESSQEEVFCFTQDVKPVLELASRNRSRVELHYANDFIMWSSECNGGQSIINQVEVLTGV